MASFFFVEGFITLFNNKRKTGIKDGYRVAWKIDNNDNFHSGRVSLPKELNILELGETSKALIIPMVAEFWTDLKEGDLLYAYEGKKNVGIFEVKTIFGEINEGNSNDDNI